MAWRENYRLWMQFVNEYKNRGSAGTLKLNDAGQVERSGAFRPDP